jgi:hypothetical protein
MEGPEGNYKAEEKPTSEEYQQETKQLLDLHRQDKVLTPSLMFRILEVSLLFVGAFAAIGVLASYGHHDTIQELFFIAAVVLVLITFLAAVWYIFVSFIKGTATPSEQKLLARFTRSSIGRSWLRLTNNRTFRLLLFPFTCVQTIYMVADAIIRFPRQPRFSLVIIVVYMALFLISATLEIARSLEIALRRDIKEVWEHEARSHEIFSGLLEILKQVDAKATEALGIAVSSRKFLEDTEPSHVEMHKSTTVALSSLQQALEAVTNTLLAKPAPPGKDKEQKSD